MNPFATLGIDARFDLDRAELEQRYRDLSRTLHPDRFAQATPSERRMSLGRAMEVNEAYRVLRDDIKRAAALLELHGQKLKEESGAQDPEFLMEVMELRESLADARVAGNLDRALELGSAVEAKLGVVREQMSERFRALGGTPVADDLASIALLLARMRYYRRFLDEVEVIEEEALEDH